VEKHGGLCICLTTDEWLSPQCRLQGSLGNTDNITHDTTRHVLQRMCKHIRPIWQSFAPDFTWKAHPHEEDVRRFVQRCLNSSRLHARHRLHRHLSATTLKRRMGYIRGILVTSPPCFPQRQLVASTCASQRQAVFQIGFCDLWSCGLSFKCKSLMRRAGQHHRPP
jgi:hypothetical protein